MVRVVALREVAMPLFHGQDPDAMAWLHLLKEIISVAQELDIALSAWAQSAPEDWKFSTTTTSAQEGTSGNGDDDMACSHVYSTHGHAAVWNHYRAVRLIVNSIRMRAFSLLLECPTQCSAIIGLKTLCQEHIDALSKDLCHSVPYFFQTSSALTSNGAENGFDSTAEIAPKMAELLAWPLTVAVSTDGVPTVQRGRMKDVLRICANASANAVLESVIERGEFRF